MHFVTKVYVQTNLLLIMNLFALLCVLNSVSSCTSLCVCVIVVAVVSE